jgi:hypothetical protein
MADAKVNREVLSLVSKVRGEFLTKMEITP